MSLAHFISLQNKNPGFDTYVNGKALAHACDALEAIAINVGVAPIMSFYGRKWYEPEKGLVTIYALIHYLEANLEVIENTTDVIEDLKEWEEVLLKANAAGIKWEMKIDY